MNELRQQISTIILEQRQTLAEQIVTRQYALQPEVWEKYGARGREISLRDAAYHLPFLTEAITAEDPSLFTDYVGWVKELFVGLKFPDSAMVVTLACTRDVLNAVLSPEMAAIVNEYLDAGIKRMRRERSATPTFLSDDTPLTGLTQQYIDALLRGERHLANQLIADAVKQGTPVKKIYMDVFQRAQYEIGRLWMSHQVSVAQEHYCTAATQFIMSQLYPYIFSTKKNGRRFVAMCVGGELHEIGVRMVTDFFEMEGWDTYYIGANTPASTIVQAMTDYRADVLGISATMTFHINVAADLIARVRESEVGKRVKILVGGYPFNHTPSLWQKLGADAYAPDAQQAVLTAERLMTS